MKEKLKEAKIHLKVEETSELRRFSYLDSDGSREQNQVLTLFYEGQLT